MLLPEKRCWRGLDTSGAKRPIDRNQCVREMGRYDIDRKRVTRSDRRQIIAGDQVLQEDGAGRPRQCQDSVTVDPPKCGWMIVGHEHMT